MKTRLLALSLAGGLAVAAASGWLFAAQQSPQRSAAELMDAVMWSREQIGGRFALTDHNGARRTNEDFRGKLMLIYFGFTFCPDICPTDLLQMARAIDQLGQAGEMVQPLFITVDPERDTPGHLKEYLSLFHPRFVGLTGNAMAVRAAANTYRVYYRKVERTDGTSYTVDHSAFIYLMGPAGEYLGFFPPGTSAEQLSGDIRPRLRTTPY